MVTTLMQQCHVHLLGLTSFDDAWALQDRLAQEIAAGQRPPTLLLLEHPHVYTLGRRANIQHLLWDEEMLVQKGIIVRQVDRGGDITYHGPGQLVGYPLLPLAPAGWQSEHLPQADFIGYIRKLETTLIKALSSLGLPAVARQGLTGVWISPDVVNRQMGLDAQRNSQPAKIASIGIKIDARGISRHGFALNINPDMDYWQGIIPCGLDGVTMISLAQLIQPVPTMEDVITLVLSAFQSVFECELIYSSRSPYAR